MFLASSMSRQALLDNRSRCLNNGSENGVFSNMEELGKVVKVNGNRAEVEVVPGKACHHCGASGLCNWGGKKVKLVTARNEIGARTGDSVILETTEPGSSYSALLVFGMPVVLMIAGIIIGTRIGGDLLAAVLAGVGLAIAFLILKFIDIRAGRSGRHLPVIVRLAEKEPKGGKNEVLAGDDAGRVASDDVRPGA